MIQRNFLCRTHGKRHALAVIIPVLAVSQQDITALLEAVSSLHESFVIVVDDGSPVDILTPCRTLEVAVIQLSVNAGPATARNVGLRFAKQYGARVVCFLDSDCVAHPNWTHAMEKAGVLCGLFC